jgi:hypothetical protein
MDAGEQAIDWLYTTQLQVDEEWSIRTPTGFTWWADKNAQTIEIVGEETGPDGEIGYLLSVRTEILRDLELTDTALVELNDGPMRCAAMAGPVYDADARTLSLCSLARVYDDIASWMRVLLSTAAVLQIAEARALGPALADSLDAQEAISGHPRNGVRPTADEMAFAAGIFVEAGKDPSKWVEAEFQDVVNRYMMRPPSIGATNGGLGFTVEFPYGDESSLCQGMGDQPHPLYGNGLLLLQRFPFDPGSQADGIKLALSLNAGDLTRHVTGYGFGSYAYADKMICFTGFYPNELHKPGLLPNLYSSCASRAEAMSMRVLNRQWDADSFSLESSTVGRIVLGDKDTGDQGAQQADLPSGNEGDEVVEKSDEVAEVGNGAMSHRFAIIPAGSVDAVDQANDLIHAMGAGSDGEPPTAIRELLDELSQTVAGSFVITRPAERRGVIIATHRPEDGLLRFMLLSTMDRGLAIYDVELCRLYDPRGRVDLDVSLSGDLTLPYLTPALLRDLVLRPTWPEPEDPYFIVTRGGAEFIQTYRDEDGLYQLEHRDGGPNAHFAVRTPDSGLVADVMWAWTTHDSRWRTAVIWSRMEFKDLEDEDNADEASSGPEIQTICVDRNSDRELTFDDTDGEPFLAYHAGNRENDKDAEGRLVPTGWVLHVDQYEPFVTGVRDFDSADEALAEANEYLGIPLPDVDNVRQVPTFGRGTALHQGVVTGDPVSGHDHDFSVYAYLSEDGFEVTTHDDGHWPVDELHTALWVEPEHVPDLILALGGRGGDNPVVLLAQQVQNGAISQFGIGNWLSEHGVQYTTDSKNVSNL